MLFRLDAVGKEYGGAWLFEDVSVQCNPGDRIGLIGRNGSGKTTVLDLVEGRQAPDAGQVFRASALRISRIVQVPEFEEGRTLRQEALRVFDYLHAMETRMQELETEMAGFAGHVPETVAAEYEALRLRFRLEGGYDHAARTEAVLLGLGFFTENLDSQVCELSGGQQSRLLLAQALLRAGDLLLLDEPTNHLDIQGILWLTEYLSALKSSFVVISHDRRFLDRVTDRTWELEIGRLSDYPGNFTRSRQLKEERVTFELKQYERQQEWKAKTEEYIRRNMAGQKTKQAQSRLKQLERTEWLERPRVDDRQIRLRIAEAGRGGGLSLELRQADIGYPGRPPLLDNLSLQIRRGERVAVVGGNGTGKTTLLRTLMGEIRPLSGHVEWGVNNYPAYFAQAQPLEDSGITVYDCLRALDMASTDLEIRNLAARFLFRDEDVFKTVSQLSGGERSRLALARLFFHPSNVLLMDEPTNHLDIQSREALEESLASYEGTLLVISHDLYFLRQVVERFFLIRERQLVPANSVEELEKLIETPAADQVEPPLEKQVARAGETRQEGPSRLSKNERLRREKRIHEIESRIQALETREQQILAEYQDQPDNYERLQELSTQHTEIQGELAQLYHSWETLMSELAE